MDERELTSAGVVSKRYSTRSGKQTGGTPFSRGAPFHLLRNRIYRGQIVHRDTVHQGEHEAIVDAELFEAVQASLDANARRHSAGSQRRIAKAPLTGKLFDAAGEPMSPAFSRGKSGRSYRYYVSSSLQRGSGKKLDEAVRRLPASEIERLIPDCVTRWLPNEVLPFAIVDEVRLNTSGLQFTLRGEHAAAVAPALQEGEQIVRASRRCTIIQLVLSLPLRGGRRSLESGDQLKARVDPVLVGALRKAHTMLRRDRSGLLLIDEAPQSPYDRRLLRLAFLAPDLQRDILAGRQPRKLNLEALRVLDIPLEWDDQRRALGSHTR